MIYMSPQSNIDGRSEVFGQIITPRTGTKAPRGIWCMDNGAFTGTFREDWFFSFLEKKEPYRDTCWFVTVPDSVANAIETQYKFRHYAWKIKAMGWPVAFVAQDGQESMPFPPEFDFLFVGGTTEWKMSRAAEYCIWYAKQMGAGVHVGRVNSLKRIRHFQLLGVDSVDGTRPAIEPDGSYKKFERQLRQKPLMEII